MAKYIDREAAISLIKQYGHDAIDGGRYSLDTVDDCIELANRIKTLTAADVAPVVYGRWIKDNDSFQTDDYCCYFDYNCSNCGEVVNDRYKLPKYCPECGAKMNEKEAVYD